MGSGDGQLMLASFHFKSLSISSQWLQQVGCRGARPATYENRHHTPRNVTKKCYQKLRDPRRRKYETLGVDPWPLSNVSIGIKLASNCARSQGSGSDMAGVLGAIGRHMLQKRRRLGKERT